MTFKFYTPYKYRKLCFGEIDNKLDFVNLGNIDTILVNENKEITVEFKPEKLGLNKIRGLLFESLLPDFRNVVNHKVDKKPIYINYYVVD